MLRPTQAGRDVFCAAPVMHLSAVDSAGTPKEAARGKRLLLVVHMRKMAVIAILAIDEPGLGILVVIASPDLA